MDQFIALTNDRGLYKKILKSGSGPFPTDNSKVLVLSKGALEDGSLIEESPQDGTHIDLSQNSVIKGLQIGVKSMQKGEKAIFVMRDDYAYGEKGNLLVPSSTSLFFCIDLIDFYN